MKGLLGITVVGGLVLGSLFLMGCASSSKDASEPDTHAYADGMMCPKCETVWVTDRTSHGKISRLSHSREMQCPDCDMMATSQLLQDGKVQLHNCPTCKVEPVAIGSAAKPKGVHLRK